jgi:hypothetical protein
LYGGFDFESQVTSGRYSYTLQHANGAVVQVLLRERAFFFKKQKGGEAWGKNAHHAWAAYDTVEAAWGDVKRQLFWV